MAAGRLLLLLLAVAPSPVSPRGRRMVPRRLSEDRVYPDPPVDTAGDQIGAPDGLEGFNVHRARPQLDGRRGRGDARRGYLLNSNRFSA